MRTSMMTNRSTARDGLNDNLPEGPIREVLGLQPLLHLPVVSGQSCMFVPLWPPPNKCLPAC